MTTNTSPLTADTIIQNLLSSKGQFRRAIWKSNPSPAAAHKKAGIVLEKKTSAVVRAGINFANLSSVKIGIEEGTRGEVQELPWGTWVQFPYVIEHKDSYYLRLYPSDTKSTTMYFVNDEEVDKDTFASYLTPSESAKLYTGEKPECFTVKRDNIIGMEEFEG
jgi:hypothetical protein